MEVQIVFYIFFAEHKLRSYFHWAGRVREIIAEGQGEERRLLHTALPRAGSNFVLLLWVHHLHLVFFILPMHSWFVHKWAAWCAGYRHACCSPVRLYTSLAHHILMGCLSQLLVTSHPSLYFDCESGKGVFRQSLLHFFFGPLLPLLLFVPSFWFWRGLWLADCCFWLPSDLYSAASVMSADTAPGLVAMPSSEEEEGLSAWSVMRRGSGSGSLLGLVLILLFLN